MENQAEFYYEKLKNSPSPGTVLCEFYTEITNKEYGRSEIIMINKLVKVFGRFTVYFAIMDLSHIVDKMGNNVYGFLYSSCKRRFERSHIDSTVSAYESLSREVTSMSKEIERIGKIKKKFPSSEGLS